MNNYNPNILQESAVLNKKYLEVITKGFILLVILASIHWITSEALTEAGKVFIPESLKGFSWAFGYYAHFIRMFVALGLIALFFPFLKSNFGLSYPPKKTYFLSAFVIGSLFGPIMLVVDYYPYLMEMKPPPGPYEVSWSNIVPWLTMQGVFVGLTEEIPYRALFLTYLLTFWKGYFTFRKFSVSWAGIFVAFLFSLAHASAFWEVDFITAFGQQIYVVILGIFYAYLFEKSGSILAPIIAHNAGDFWEWVMCFLFRYLWS